MRLFIAINLPQNIKDMLEYYKEQCLLNTKEIKQIKPDNLHITLFFLGDVPFEKLSLIKHTLNIAVYNTPMFNLELDNIGTFPNPKKPKIIWVGIKPNKIILSLQNKIASSCTSINFKEDKPFQPHITIARIKTASILPLTSIWKCKLSFPESSFTIRKIDLMESILSKNGPVYSCIYSANLS